MLDKRMILNYILTILQYKLVCCLGNIFIFLFTILYSKIVLSMKGGNALESSQILKGILEGCLLAIISKGETYGYEMIEKLGKYGFIMVREGSIYPLLLRMRKEKLVEVKTKPVPSGGPQRKYYYITNKGLEELEKFKEIWMDISTSVNMLLDQETKGEIEK